MEKVKVLFVVAATLFVLTMGQQEFGGELGLDSFEKDKLLTCAEILNRKFTEDQVIFDLKVENSQ